MDFMHNENVFGFFQKKKKKTLNLNEFLPDIG